MAGRALGAEAGLNRRAAIGGAVCAFIAVLWLGMLAGVSFLATPVKFQAPSLDLAVALDVGRTTFAAFIRVEWVLLAVLAGVTAIAAGPGRRPVWAGIVLLGILVVVQGVWLLPALDARVAAIIAGQTLPASPHHLLYAGAEAVKALILLGLSIHALCALARRRDGPRQIEGSQQA